MEAPITNHNPQTDLTVTAPPKTEPAKKPSATKQQMKAAYIMVLMALMDSLKTSNQTAQVQAKEQNQSINAQQKLIGQMRALKSVDFSHSDAFVDCHYWRVVFYTQIIHSGAGSNSKDSVRHTMTVKYHLSSKALWNRLNPNGMQSTRIKETIDSEVTVAKTFWKPKALSAAALKDLNIEISMSDSVRSTMEAKINIGQQKSSIDDAAINMTVQGLQELVSEIGNVSQDLGTFSSRIASM